MTDVLLAEIARLKRDRTRYREALRKTRISRDAWKARAVELAAARRRGQIFLSTPSTALSPAERAEAS